MSIITDKSKLKERCNPVSLFEVGQIVSDLEQELNASIVPGVGLAHNQIGGNKKVCIIRYNNTNLNLANPEIIESYDLMEFEGEGCLSFPDKSITTKRYNEIVVRDLFHPSGIILTGIDAVITQHEISHLEGLVMYDFEIKRPKLKDKCWCKSNKRYSVCHKGKVIK